jgi:hypothetical protein
MVRIDALGIHEISLRKLGEALKLLTAWLPRGRAADPDAGRDADALLTTAERSALVTVTSYSTQGSAETAGTSTDLVLARHGGQLHAFARDPQDATKLRPGALAGKDVPEALAGLLARDAPARR